MCVARRARGAERRPERGAKRRTEAGAESLGPDGLPTCDFLNCKYGFGNIMLLSKNACYSAKSMLLSQKQRRYTYDSIVYAPTLTLLTILFILQVLIKAHLSFVTRLVCVYWWMCLLECVYSCLSFLCCSNSLS